MHHAARSTLAAVFCLTVGGACAESFFGPPSEQLIAEKAATAWVARHPLEWAGAITSSAVPTRPEWTPSCSSPLTNGYVSLRLQTAGGDIELAFRCPLDEHATPEILQEHFVRAVPWNLPTGVNVPNWHFQAWLPFSSIYDGVTFHAPQPGLLAVDIRSNMLGIRGQSTRGGCRVVPDLEDADSRCLIRRANAVPMMMRFTVPADLSALH